MRMNEPPCPTSPPRKPIVNAIETARGRLNRQVFGSPPTDSSDFGSHIISAAMAASPANTTINTSFATHREITEPASAAAVMALPIETTSRRLTDRYLS